MGANLFVWLIPVGFIITVQFRLQSIVAKRSDIVSPEPAGHRALIRDRKWRSGYGFNDIDGLARLIRDRAGSLGPIRQANFGKFYGQRLVRLVCQAEKSRL